MGFERRGAGLLRSASGTRVVTRLMAARPTRRVPEPAIQVAGARRSDGGPTHDDGARSERVRGRSSMWAAERAARVLGLRWSRRADDGRLAPARRSTALPGVVYAQYASIDRTCARVVPRAFTLFFFSPGVWPGAAAAGNETQDAGQAPARASFAGLPISP